MRYYKVRMLKASRFRRFTGVQKPTFNRMVKVLKEAKAKQHWHGGRPSRLTIEDSLLMTLMYGRENRTYFHVAQAYGVSDSVCWNTIRWIENALIQSRVFRLPGKKALLDPGMEWEGVLIDATETPIERPKKNNGVATRERKSGTR